MTSRFRLNYVARIAIGLVASSAGTAAMTQAACDPSKYDYSSGYDISLLIGQSNMVGHNAVDDPNGPYKKNRSNILIRWTHDGGANGGDVKNTSPDNIPHQRSHPGVGPGASFAKSYLQWLQIQPNSFDGTNRYVLSSADGSQRHTFYATFFMGADSKPYVRVMAGHNVSGALREWSSKDVLLPSWVHIAAAFNSDPTTPHMALWVNGVHQTSSTATNFAKADPSGVAWLTLQVAGYAPQRQHGWLARQAGTGQGVQQVHRHDCHDGDLCL